MKKLILMLAMFPVIAAAQIDSDKPRADKLPKAVLAPGNPRPELCSAEPLETPFRPGRKVR